MKLLFISTLYSPNQVGGAEKIVQILAEALAQAGHECAVASTRAAPGLESCVVNGVRAHYIGLRNVYWPYGDMTPAAYLKPVWHLLNRYNAAMGREIARILDQERPDVVNTHGLTGFSPSAWVAARERGIPVLHTLHDYSLMCPKASMFRAGANCAQQCRDCRALTRPAARESRHVQAVVSVSSYTLARHLDHGYFAGARIKRVIHNGLSGVLHPPAPDAARGRLPLRLGFVGRLVQPKGIEELVRVMRDIDPLTCELVVAGKGTETDEQRLRELAPQHVRFVGFVNPEELYRCIDVLVVPSLWQDPLPTTAIEAARHGVPAIVANRGGLPDIVLDGRTGQVYQAGEVGALREAIAQFIRNPARAAGMAPQVLERAEHFSVDRMEAEYMEVFSELHATTRVERN